MEHLQIGYVRTVAAASGAVVSGVPEIDEGIDMVLTHKSEEHLYGVARLEIQLKSTSRVPSRGRLSVTLEADRFEYLRSEIPALGKILIVMSVPKEQDKWVLASKSMLKVRHAAYWANLADLPPAVGDSKTVSVPTSQIFDDVALCAIMARIGQGGRP